MRSPRLLTAAATATAGMTAACVALTTLAASPAGATTTPPVKPVPSIQVSRYLGQWYQVAAIPAPYEAFCQKDSIAHYAAGPSSTITVTNTCQTVFGLETVNGSARPDNAPKDSVLTVSFFNLFGTWQYSSTPNYEVIGLDPAYQWAVVASPDHASAFVLSRTAAIPAVDATRTRAALTASGFDPCSLDATPQDGGSMSSAPYCA